MEVFFSCPYCWTSISMVVDASAESQTYIEDCENCCHPIQISYKVEDETVTELEAIKAQ